MTADRFFAAVWPNSRSAAAFQLWMIPSSDLLMIASSDDSTIEARSRALKQPIRLVFFPLPPLRDVAERSARTRTPHPASSLIGAALSSMGRSTPSLRDEQRVVGQPHDDALAQALWWPDSRRSRACPR